MSLIEKYKFIVAQDQDYLNVICKDKVRYIGMEWNRMPIGGEDENAPKLIHYNLTMKPWHYDNILFQEYFWYYAERSPFYEQIILNKQNFGEAEREQKEVTAREILEHALMIVASDNTFSKKLCMN